MASPEPPGLLVRLLMKVDPFVFYCVMCTFRFTMRVLDNVVLSPLFGRTLEHGPNAERENAKSTFESSCELNGI